jgi:hypothetical protein
MCIMLLKIFLLAEYSYSDIGMDSNRIRTDTSSDVTIYHILIRIWIKNGNFEFTFEYLLDL